MEYAQLKLPLSLNALTPTEAVGLLVIGRNVDEKPSRSEARH